MHYAGLAEALNLGAALNMLLSEIIIFGIQPENIDRQEGLSAALALIIPDVCQAIVNQLEAHHA